MNELVDTLGNLKVKFNLETGMPESIFDLQEGCFFPTIGKLSLTVGGHEERSPTGGIEYRDCLTLSGTYDPIRNEVRQDQSDNSTYVPIKFGDIKAWLKYELDKFGSTISISVRIQKHEALVRNLILDLKLEIGVGNWVLNAPGNGVRSGLPLIELTDSVGISPLGGLRGSSALAHLSNGVNSVVLWCDNLIEIPEILLGPFHLGALQYQVKSNFAADLAKVDEVEVALVTIDVGKKDWKQFSQIFQEWLISIGLRSPANPPSWINNCLIYEVQIGFSVFGKVNTYSPYPTVREVITDLPRISNLGFKCLQIMPQQPYPSYNVHDYYDIDTSYGDVNDLKELIELSHENGIKVILDVLLHGVLDREIIKIAADAVRSGPFATLLNSETGDSFSSDVKDWSNYAIAWSRHILDFEPYWISGSPERTNLEDLHPEWFYRDSTGEIAGVYTKAFDASHRSWQNYFIDAMLNLVKILNIDGFRFDAPTYNNFPNWSESTRHRASASPLACVSLFERMRPRLKEKNPDFLFYTEPSGLALRKSMDLNYNYDEQWLVTSIATPSTRNPWGVSSGKQLANWFADRDALLPNGSLTAHHIDSHDTFWWPSWGNKWRRQQFGLQLTRMLYVVFGSLPGPFMLFVGGEEGILDLIPKIAEFKMAISGNEVEHMWWLAPETAEALFGLTYTTAQSMVTVLVNASSDPLECSPEINISESDAIIMSDSVSFKQGMIILGGFGYLVVESKR